MEALSTITAQLKETLFGVADDEVKEEIIIEHIKAAEKLKYVIDDFPPDLDWFNTSQPLCSDLLKGKIVVLDFFTYCCINCLHIIPYLRQLEENFSVADGLVVLGIHSAKFDNEKDSGNILQAVKRLNIAHPVINDKNCSIWNKLEISCWPTILILGPQRQPIFVLVGEADKDKLLLLVKVALKYYKTSLSSHSLPLVNCDQIVTSSLLSFPGKIARWENQFAVSDSGNHRILIFNPEGHIQFQIGGKTAGFNDGSFEAARFNSPQGLVFYNSSSIYVADTENHAIRLIDLVNLKVQTVVGNGHQGMDNDGGKIGLCQEISSPWDVCIVPSSDFEGNLDLKNTLSSEISSAIGFDLPPIPSPPPPPPPSPFIIPPPPPGPSTVSSPSDSNCSVSVSNAGSGGAPPPPGFYLPPISIPSSGVPPPPPPCPAAPPPPPSSCAGDSSTSNQHNSSTSKVLLIAAAGTHQIWAYFIDCDVGWKRQLYEKNTCAAIAGSGKEENRNNSYPMRASFAQPSGLTYSSELQSVFIADAESSSIRKFNLKDGSVSHVVGGTKSPDDLFSYGDADGKGYDVRLQHPLGVAWSIKENALFVCDTYNHKIKKVNVSEGECLTFIKTPGLFNEPGGCCLNETEDALYIADTNNNCIQIINLSDNTVQKLNLIEQQKHMVDAPVKDAWEVETSLSKAGGTLTLKINFEPQEIHGKWQLGIDESKVKVNSTKGQIETGTLDIIFTLDPSEDDDIIEVFFDLVLCGSETCNFKKLTLKVNVKRNNEAESQISCNVRKSLL